MCYCLFGILSCSYALLLTAFVVSTVISSLVQSLVHHEDHGIPFSLALVSTIWLLIDQSLQLSIFAMFKSYDPVFKFVATNLGETNCFCSCNCCGYLDTQVTSKTKTWTVIVAFLSRCGLLIFNKHVINESSSYTNNMLDQQWDFLALQLIANLVYYLALAVAFRVKFKVDNERQL